MKLAVIGRYLYILFSTFKAQMKLQAEVKQLKLY